MIQLDEKKLAGLHTAGELLSSKYGAEGTESRWQFHQEALAYYYGTILRDRRKSLKMTQQELADKAGMKRSYIAKVESGKSDIQVSSLLRILSALDISLRFEMA